jgi:hypothetical protein
LDKFTKEEMVVITLGLALADIGSFKSWAAVIVQDFLRMMLTGKNLPETPGQMVCLSALPGAHTWEHPREKTPNPRKWARRTFIYPMEIADIMELVKCGQQHTFPRELGQIGAEIAGLCGGWAQAGESAIYGYYQAHQINPVVAQ